MPTLINTPSIGFLVDPSEAVTDAFGRQRISGTGHRLDSEFIYDKQVNFFDEVTNNGTVTHNADGRDLTLALSDAVDGSYALMRSHPAPYTPGNSQLVDITGVLNLTGIAGSTAEYFLRSSVSGVVAEEVFEQSGWDELRENVDWSASHIFTMDFQSLKVGTIRFGLVANGAVVYVGAINNDNIRDGGYWQLPSQGCYWRIYNDAVYTYMETGYGDEANAIGFRVKVPANATATMKAICCTVKSEGGADLADMPGIERAVDMGITPKTVSTTLIPLLSIRARATFNSLPSLALIVPKDIISQTTEAIKLVLVADGTLTGASWANVDTSGSAVESDVAASAIAGGQILSSEYIYATASGPAASRATGSGNTSVLGKTVLWDRQGAETGVLSVCAVRTGASDASMLAGIQWKEIR